MLQTVKLQPKSLADYAPIVGDEAIEHIRALAEPLKGARVVHVSARCGIGCQVADHHRFR